MISPPQDWNSFDWDSLDWDSFTGYDDLILSSIFFTLTEVPVEAKLKLPPLFAPTGKHLLKHLVVDLWGPGGGIDDLPCIGPWKWFKFAIDPSEGHAYVRLIYLSPEPIADPYYDGSSVATLATGIPFASSTYTDVWGSYPPDGVFDVESGVPWVSESGDPSPWIAFRFNDPTEFSYLHIMTLVGTAEGIPAMTGGDVYVSNDSTDGIDGTWRLLRSGILDQSGIDNEVFLGVSLCTDDPVEVFYTPS